MTGEQRDQVNRIVDAILCVSADRRGRALDALCPAGGEVGTEGATEIRAEVERLLAGDDELAAKLAQLQPPAGSRSVASETKSPASLLDPPRADDALDSESTTTATSTYPAKIGRYRIRSLLGSGGMGQVCLADSEGPIRQTVAIKLIKSGFDTVDVIARFEAERQTLARMDHPGIARIIDAGATETGRPFFVMEFVPGMPITQFADEQRLSIRQRIELFADVCEAVAHAHTKGVIHRDLKPSNVLARMDDGADGVARPRVKVIDFGIAKAVSGDGPTSGQTYVTRAGTVLGTYEYMSPEQASGSSDLDTRTDVYSLGVMLYELLTGALPFDPKAIRASDHDAIERMIREVAPPRPSTRISGLGGDANAFAQRRQESVDSLRSTLRNELEWIPLKAMRKEREQRYRSPMEMADDVRNYLAGSPLIAGPESKIYRTRKFLRRYRVPVSVAATMLLLLIAGAVGTTYQWYRANQQRRIADQQRTIAIAQRAAAEQRFADVRALAKGMLFQLSPKVDSLAGSTPAVKLISDLSLEYLAKLQAERSDDFALVIDVSRAYAKLGDIQGNQNFNNLGDVESAKRSYQKAREMADRALAINPNAWQAKHELGIATMRAGNLFERQGKREDAVREYDAAQKLLDDASRLAPSDYDAVADTILPSDHLADAQMEMGRADVALATLKGNLERAQTIAAQFPNHPMAQTIVPRAERSLAEVQTRAGEYPAAAATLRDAIVKFEMLHADAPDDVGLRRRLADAHNALARVLMTYLDDRAGAAISLEKAVPLLRQNYAADTNNSNALEGLAHTLALQGALLAETGAAPRAQSVFNEVIDLYKRGLEITPDDRTLRQMLIVTYGGLADVFEQRNDLPPAIAARRQALKDLQPIIDADPKNLTLQAGLGYTRWQLAGTLYKMRDMPACIAENRGAIAIFQQIESQSPDDVQTMKFIADAQRSLCQALTVMAQDEHSPGDVRERARVELVELIPTLRIRYTTLRDRGALPKAEQGLFHVLDEAAKEFGSPTTRESRESR